jgi:hypothetical protein
MLALKDGTASFGLKGGALVAARWLLRMMRGGVCLPALRTSMQRYGAATRRTSVTFEAMVTPAQFVRLQGAVVH